MDTETVAHMRLLASDRADAAAMARAAAAILMLLAAAFLVACSTTDSTAQDATSEPAAPRPTATEGPPTDVTIVPLTPPPADVVRPGQPGSLDGEVTDATAEPDLCPDPFLEGHELHGSETVRLASVPPDVLPPPPARIDVPPLATDTELGEAILELLGDEADRHAVVVKDLRDGRGVAINADRLFYAASLFKLEVMFETVRQAEAGAISLDEEYNVSDYYAEFGLGPHLIVQCETVTLGRALTAMMSVSDNVAAVMLQDRAGPRNINNTMQALGLSSTALLPENTLPTTAADMALMMEWIARGQAISEAASLRMVELMAQEKVNDRIPQGVPEGTLVAHKTGNWENATHDAGIVYGAKSTYVVVLMSDIGFDGNAGAVQRAIMRAVWAHFEGEG
jgi:beta-lactamase class A